MRYNCEILADSISPTAARLTTFEITFPRMVLADITRHRCASYSFESTRAVPVEKRIEMVRNEPFIPVFRERTTGMAQGAELTGTDLERARAAWRFSSEQAAHAAEGLLHVEKGLAGRLLEPYSWITGIMSATEWDNFFNLRCHPAAQRELQIIAEMMRDARQDSIPNELGYGEWHLPFITDEHYDQLQESELPYESAGICAAVSYLRQHDDQPLGSGISRWHEKLAPSNHWSPGEHPARVVTEDEQRIILERQDEEYTMAAFEARKPQNADQMEFFGNFRGFVQLRKHYPGNEIAQTPA